MKPEMTTSPEVKIATLNGVREYNEGFPVELWLNGAGRVVLRAFNEDRHNSTDVDFISLLDWCRTGFSDAGNICPEALTIVRGFERDKPSS